jgi:phosphate uptake regulator
MARVEFQAQLHQLEANLQEQGALVLRAVRGAMNALETQDAELCDEVIAFDDEIDNRYHRIGVDQAAAQQAPVASDLRLILAVLTPDPPERIGDQSVTVAKLRSCQPISTRTTTSSRGWGVGDRAEWCDSRSTHCSDDVEAAQTP